MVLVFAFGFLVYHKMDMHQRALTQASIAGPGTAATTTTAAGAAELPQQSVAADPLLDASASSQSPFAASDSDPPNFPVTLSERGTSADGDLSEPAIASAADLSPPGFNDSTAAPEPADAGVNFQTENSPIGTDAPSVVLNEPSVSDAPPQFMATAVEPTTSEPTTAEPATIEPADTQPSTPETTETVLPTIGGDPDFAEATAADSGEFPIGAPAAEPSTTPISEPTPVLTDATFDASGEESETTGTSETTETPSSTDEPMLLAMAEPQEPPAFSGFTPDEPVQRAPATEPVFGEVPERNRSVTEAGRTAAAFPESAGFNAVARPADRPSRQALRSASGSGSDGRFDLAAFNYQNSPQPNPTSDASDVPTVIVQEGENYTKLSKRVYGTSRYFSALAVFNQHRIPDPRKMRPGMIVLTPDRRLLEEKYPQLFVDSLPRVVEPPGFLLLEDGSPAYRVGDRETLSDISKKHLGRASRWIELYEMNRSVVNDPNRLRSGTILALPDDATEVVIMP